MPPNRNIILHLTIDSTPDEFEGHRKALHVQSRSYWAPANIGPYSQAISTPMSSPVHPSGPEEHKPETSRLVHIAGQIPLVPATMVLPSPSLTGKRYIPPFLTSLRRGRWANPEGKEKASTFPLQAVLSLQHLFRIAAAQHVPWFTGAIAFLPSPGAAAASVGSSRTRSLLAGLAWETQHRRAFRAYQKEVNGDSDSDDDDDERDLWDERFRAGFERGGSRTDDVRRVPDYAAVETPDEAKDGRREAYVPPCFAVEVDALPRGAAVEWQALPSISGGGIKVRFMWPPSLWPPTPQSMDVVVAASTSL